MKTKNLLGVLALTAACSLPCSAQQALIPAGNSNLTPGQYVLTNLGTGQALIVVIDQTGRLFAQDPRLLQVVVQQGVQPGQPGIGQVQPQQQGGFGGLIKQGLEDLVKTRGQQGFAPGN